MSSNQAIRPHALTEHRIFVDGTHFGAHFSEHKNWRVRPAVAVDDITLELTVWVTPHQGTAARYPRSRVIWAECSPSRPRPSDGRHSSSVVGIAL